MSLGLHGMKLLADQVVAATSTAIAHGMLFTPIVYSVVAKHASAARSVSVISVDATNVTLIASGTGTTADIILGAPAA